MATERIRRRIEQLLDEADQAVAESNWALVRDRVENVLRLDPENPDALAFLAAAERDLATTSAGQAVSASESPGHDATQISHPTSFANGRYAVKRFLGEGGKKRVYLAHDTLLDRDVAFALIKTEGLDEAGRERVRREAQAMGRLTSPHIVTVFEVGSEGDAPYMVTELLTGGFVEDAIEKADDHKLSLERVLDIAQQVCQGLEVAHQRGVVHRDLKPGNVGLMAEGTVKIADFGLAVAIDRSRLTQAGMMVGTVSYMPPEQALGGEITAKSDLYSTGCMLYEMVTGRPPFVGDDNVAIIGQHLNTPPVSPSWHRPDLPRGLEALILRLLEKDPSKRPSSATDVREALASVDLAGGWPTTENAEAPIQNPLYRRTFVGREAELKQLQNTFDGAMSGQGALAMVVGEPGIGKTAIVEQLATYVSLRGGRTLVGHCYEEGSLSLPYLAFVEAMRSYVLTREPDALKSDLGTGAADVARIVSEIRDRVQVELRPLGDPEDDRWRLFQAVSGFLRNAAQVQPLLIVLEDLHWADRGTLDLLLHAARNIQGARLLIVGTYRDVEVDRAHPLSATLADLSRIGAFSRVRLRGLTAEEVQRILSALLTQDVQWALAEAVHRQTEGNPLFVQEVVRYLAEEGLIGREEGRWRRTSDQPLSMAIPEGLRDVIGKRLSRLSAECNRLLATAAVIGRDFDLATLRAVAIFDENALVVALEEATKVGVLEERSQPGVILYRFTHAFFRQTLYEELSAPRRLRLHQEVARALEQQYAERRQDHAAELAEHFANSTDRADLERAVQYGGLAAKRAISVFDYGEAVRLLERAIDVQEVLDPDDKAQRCDLMLALCEALGPAGWPQRVYEGVAKEALVLAEALGDDGKAAHACQLALVALFRYGGLTARGSAAWQFWAELADRYARPQTVDRIYADLAMAQFMIPAEKFSEAVTLWKRARALAEQLGVPEALFAAADVGYQVLVLPTQQQERLKLAEESLALTREGVSPFWLGNVLYRAGLTYVEQGREADKIVAWKDLAELARRTADPLPALRSLSSEAHVHLRAGRLEDNIATGDRMIAYADEYGASDIGRGMTQTFTLRARLHLGQAAEWLARANEVQQMRQLNGLPLPTNVNVQYAQALAHSGRLADAEDMARSYLDKRLQAEDGIPAEQLVRLLEVAVLAGAEEMAASLEGRVALIGSSFAGYACVARLLGAAAEFLGKPSAARAYYDQALEVCSKVSFRPEIALTRLQLAELLLQQYPDERAEALDHLDFAISEFREMKMQPSLERALRHRGLLKA